MIDLNQIHRQSMRIYRCVIQVPDWLNISTQNGRELTQATYVHIHKTKMKEMMKKRVKSHELD